jgi:hypothetical protein
MQSILLTHKKHYTISLPRTCTSDIAASTKFVVSTSLTSLLRSQKIYAIAPPLKNQFLNKTSCSSLTNKVLSSITLTQHLAAHIQMISNIMYSTKNTLSTKQEALKTFPAIVSHLPNSA